MAALSKEAIRVTVEGKAIVPQTLDPARPDHLELAEALLAAFRAGGTRDAIDEAVEPIVLGARGPKIARGLVEVLFAQASFARADPGEAVRVRRLAFEGAAAARAARTWDRRTVLAAAGLGEVEIYPALRGADRLESLPPLDAPTLLARYNRALVETIVAKAVALEGQGEPALLAALESAGLPVRTGKGGSFRVDARKGGRTVQRRWPDAIEALERSRRASWTWTVPWGRRRLELRGRTE